MSIEIDIVQPSSVDIEINQEEISINVIRQDFEIITEVFTEDLILNHTRGKYSTMSAGNKSLTFVSGVHLGWQIIFIPAGARMIAVTADFQALSGSEDISAIDGVSDYNLYLYYDEIQGYVFYNLQYII